MVTETKKKSATGLVVAVGVGLVLWSLLSGKAAGENGENGENGGNGGDGIIPGPITFSNFNVTDFTIRADSGWWGTNYLAVLTYSFDYFTSSAIPDEPANNPRLLVDVTFADKLVRMIATPTTQYIGPFQFPAGLTTREFPVQINVGAGQNPYNPGDTVPVSLKVLAELAGVESLGGRTFTGQSLCLGLQ